MSKSSIPYTGKGLFTNHPIDKGTLIIEYTGEITTWEAVRRDSLNVYIYFVNEEYVINAKNDFKSLARYANDANGPIKIKGIDNNSTFVNIDGKIYIRATRNIPSSSEILVNYGIDYWETIKKNSEIQKPGKFSKKYH